MPLKKVLPLKMFITNLKKQNYWKYKQQICFHAMFRSNRVYNYLRQCKQSESWYEFYLKVQQDNEDINYEMPNTTA
jgi:hypothetical protein